MGQSDSVKAYRKKKIICTFHKNTQKKSTKALIRNLHPRRDCAVFTEL